MCAPGRFPIPMGLGGGILLDLRYTKDRCRDRGAVAGWRRLANFAELFHPVSGPSGSIGPWLPTEFGPLAMLGPEWGGSYHKVGNKEVATDQIKGVGYTLRGQ